jgi:hypothetical protein
MTPSSADKCQRGRDPVVREDGSIEIPLTHGQVAVVDAASYDVVRDSLWWAVLNVDTRSWYAIGQFNHRGTGMSRELLGNPVGLDVDHIDHDTLNNRMANLRAATTSGNMANRRPNRNTTSRFKGVAWKKQNRQWVAQIAVQKRKLHIGLFRTEEEAARAYDAAARLHFGEFAFTNEDAGLLPAMKETGT